MTIDQWLGEHNKLGIDIWTTKYRNGEESFEEWLDRISAGNNEIRDLIIQKKFLFGGRILANRGLHKEGKKVTYSNCYVISPPGDSIESIFECATKLARTYSYGGGCGIDISNLAPAGAKVNNTAKYTTGAVSFMDLYSMITGLIGQNGRRGALMLSLDCSHPDLERFINIKRDLNKVTSANISIRFSDEFMRAVDENKEYDLVFERKETGEKIKTTIKAREIFQQLSDANWAMGEPGCLFWDKIASYNLLENSPEFSYAGTNPCAEEPLPAGGSCLLGSINLSEFVLNPFEPNSKFDFINFAKTVKASVHALNEVLDEGLPLHPLQEQKDSVRDWRQIGLGVMGIADMLIKMGITYGSEESFICCEEIARAMTVAAIEESIRLGERLGAFPKCNITEIMSTEFFKNHSSDLINPNPVAMRNSQLLTIAPTGTLSTMLGISGGIEPIFANSYTRTTKSLHGKDVDYKVYTPIVETFMKKFNIKREEDLPEYFITAQNIHYSNRIEMQAVWQRHIDASISSTVNLPNSATKEDVLQLYIDAWKAGLKGITIFRDGCERVAILNTGNKKEETKEEGLKRGEIIPTDDSLIGKKRKLMTGCGSLHCTAFFDPITKELREIYLSKGSTGGCNNFMIGLSRMISLSARAGVNVYDIIDQLNSCGVCPSYATRRAIENDTSPGSCCPVAIGKALKEMYEEFNAISKEEKVDKTALKCPKCDSELIHEGGCNICKNCGWSKCD